MSKMTSMLSELLGVDPQQIKEREQQTEQASLGVKAASGLETGVDRWSNMLQRAAGHGMAMKERDESHERRDEGTARQKTTEQKIEAEGAAAGAGRVSSRTEKEQAVGAQLLDMMEKMGAKDPGELSDTEKGEAAGPSLG